MAPCPISGIIPNNMLLTYFRPRIFFPTMIIIWAGFTMATASARRPTDIMCIRVFQGYAESCIFSGTHYLLGSWYTEKELGKRSGLFTASGLAGGMFGGFLQSAIHKSMNGLQGLPGWRWLFMVRFRMISWSEIFSHFPPSRLNIADRYLNQPD